MVSLVSPIADAGDPAPHIALSVIVPSVNTLEDVGRALTALECERADVALEILLVDRLGEPVRAAVRSRFPHVRILDAPATATDRKSVV